MKQRRPYILICSTVVSFLTVTVLQSAPPAWWSYEDATATPPITPVVDSTATENNKGAANLGQAKYMVIRALAALEEVDSATAAAIRADLIGDPLDLVNHPQIFDVDNAVPANPDQAWYDAQKGALRVGQLKALAKPFYDHLHATSADWLSTQLVENQTGSAAFTTALAAGPVSAIALADFYPWTHSDATDDNNKGMASVGQLKAAFALRFVALNTYIDSDGDGLLNSFELAYGLNPNNSDEDGSGTLDGQDDFDLDGLSNLAEYTGGTDPQNSFDNPVDLDNDGKLDASEPPLALDPTKRDNPAVGLVVFVY